MKNYLNRIVINVLLIIITVSSCAQNNKQIKSGSYDDGQLEIFVNNECLYGFININEDLSCRLFFWGDLNDKKSQITIFNPIDESINIGIIVSSSKSITLKTNIMLMPCQRIIDLKRGWTFDYTSKSNWNDCSFDFVKANKSFLYSKPNVLTKNKSYLIKNDAVLIFEEKGNWVKIKYINNKKSFFWINKNDLYKIKI